MIYPPQEVSSPFFSLSYFPLFSLLRPKISKWNNAYISSAQLKTFSMDASGGCHPKWGNLITKEHTCTWYILSDKWILAQKLGILLRRGNKIPMEEVTETKFRAETEGTTIHRLPHLVNHPINNHQTQTLWQMPTRACWQEPDIAVSWEALPVPGKYRSGCSQSSSGQSTGSPMKELKKGHKELKGFVAP